MQTIVSRWLMFGLLIGWSLSHATVLAQPVRTGPADKIRQGLDKVISADYNGQSLSDAINHLREKSGLRINIDQVSIMQTGMNPDDNIGQVTVKGSNEKAGQVLRRLLNTYNLTYIVFEEAVLVTTEEMAIHRQFRQRVSVDLEDVPFKKAVRDLARAHGINLVIDPKIANEVEAKVSLQLDNTDLETTIRLLAEVASLKALPMGNVIFVTNEDKAKKLREEDRLQNDNPLNPGIQRFGVPPAVFNRAGGLGGIAMPARPPAVPANAGPPVVFPLAEPAAPPPVNPGFPVAPVIRPVQQPQPQPPQPLPPPPPR